MITFHQDCTVYEIEKDGWGDDVKKNKQDLKCRVKEQYQLVKDDAAKETVSELEFTFPPNAKVNVDYKIEYKDKEHNIISIKITRNTIGEVVKKVIYV